MSAVKSTTTLRVQQIPKKGYFQTVGDALQEATMGATILISAGTYMESDLLLSRPNLTLQAEGDGVPVITSHGTTLQITATVSIVGIRVATEDPRSAAVLVAAGQPSFNKCHIQSMHVDMDSEPTVTNSHITGSMHTGLFVSGSAGGTYRDNVIKTHEGFGVYVNSAGSPQFLNNQFSQTLLGPIIVCGPRSTPVFRINNIQDSTMIPAAHDTRRSSVESNAVGGGGAANELLEAAAAAAPIHKRAAVVVTGGACPTFDGNIIFSCVSTGVMVAAQWDHPSAVPQTPPVDSILERGGTPRMPVRRRGVQMVSHNQPGGHGGGGGGNSAPAASGGATTLVRNMIRDNNGTGIVCHGAGVRVMCEGNTVDSNGKEGLRVSAGATMVCTDDSIRGHATTVAVRVSDPHTQLALNKCTVADGLHGIVVTNYAMMRASTVTCEKLGTALLASHGATVEADDCTVVDNDNGVVVETNAVFDCVHSEFRANAVGAAVTTNGKLNLHHCTLRRNKVAVQSTMCGAGTVASNVIMESDTAQIIISDRGATHFIDNTIKDAPCSAVQVRSFGLGTFRNNTFSGHNKAATVRVETGGDPHFEGNTFEGSAVELVIVEKHGAGTFLRNRLSSCQRSAVVARNGACPTFRDNTITGNSGAGVELQDGAAATIERNTFRENGECGVLVKGAASFKSVISLNVIEMSRIGVDVTDNARGLIGRCIIQNCEVGVRCVNRNDVAIVRNEITSCAVGIDCATLGSKPMIMFNRIHGNSECGVRVASDSAPTLHANCVLGHFGPKTAGVDLRSKSAARLLSNVISMNDVGVLVADGALGSSGGMYHNVLTDNGCGLRVSGNFVGGSSAALRSEAGSSSSRGGLLSSTSTHPGKDESGVFLSLKSAALDVVEAELAEELTVSLPPVREKHGPKCMRNTFCRNHVGVSMAADSYASLHNDGFIGNYAVGVSVATATSSLNATHCFFASNGRYNAIVYGDAGKGRSNADAATAKPAGGLRRAGAKTVVATSRYEPVVFEESAFVGPCSPVAVRNGREDVFFRRSSFLSCPFLVTSEGAPRGYECFFSVLPTAFIPTAASPAISDSPGKAAGASSGDLRRLASDGSMKASGAPTPLHKAHSSTNALSRKHGSTSSLASGTSSAAPLPPTAGNFSGRAAFHATANLAPMGGAIDAALVLQAKARGEFLGCVVRGRGSPHALLTGQESLLTPLVSSLGAAATAIGPMMHDGISGQKSTTVLRRWTVSGCAMAGIHVQPGFGGIIESAVVFNNAGCGIRVTGRMAAPACIERCKIFGHVVNANYIVPPTAITPRYMSLLHDPTSSCPSALPAGPTFNIAEPPELPDVSDDDAYTGAESDTNSKTETHSVPKYTMPNTEGHGVGVVIGGSGAALMTQCEVFASGLANVLVASKTTSTIEKCVIHSSEGYGFVLRAQTHLTLKECRVEQNTYAGLLAESHCAPILNACAFEENGIGAVLLGDDCEFSRCNFTSNRIAGVRAADGSHAAFQDCSMAKNAVGVEARYNTSTSPAFTHCNIHANIFCGVMASGGSRPTFNHCQVFDHHGICGIMARCGAAPNLRGCLLGDNAVGFITRILAEPIVTETTMEGNKSGLIAEWGGGGSFHKCTFVANRSESVLIRTLADPTVRQSIFLETAPIVVTTEGKGKLDANTFRKPTGGCINVIRGGAPVITDSLFSCLQADSATLERLRGEFGKFVTSGGPMEFVRGISMEDSFARGGGAELLQAATTVFAPVTPTADSLAPPGSPGSPVGTLTRRRTDLVRKDQLAVLEGTSHFEGAMPEDPDALAPSDDDAFIPVKFESGGQGELRRCVFVHNDPCSVLCDGATTEPMIESCIFFRHSRVGMSVCNGAIPKIRDTAFIQNGLGLQLGRTPSIIADCWFLSNTTAVEADAAVTGMLSTCTFLDDNLSINVLPNSGFSVRKCTFYRCDSCVVMGPAASGTLEECRCTDTTKTAFIVHSGGVGERPTRVSKCTFARGACGVDLENGGEAEVTSCEFIGTEKYGLRVHNSTRTTLSKCKFQGCATGLLVDGSQCVPDVTDSTFASNRIGLEVTMGGNPTVSTCSLRQCRIGLYVHTDGLGIFKRLELSGNGTAVYFKSGVEGFPSLTHSNIFDSEECAVNLSNHAVGEIVDCHMFDNRVGIVASGVASTLFDHTKMSHADNKVVAEPSMIRKESTMVKLLLGPNFQMIYEHSPAHNQMTFRQRKVEASKLKTQNTNTLERAEVTDLKAERTSRVDVQGLFNRLGVDPLFANTMPPAATDLLTTLEFNAKEAAEEAATAARKTTPSTMSRTAIGGAPKADPDEKRRLPRATTTATGVRPRQASNGSSAAAGLEGDMDASGSHSIVSFVPAPPADASASDPLGQSKSASRKGPRKSPSRGKSPGGGGARSSKNGGEGGASTARTREVERLPSPGIATTRVKKRAPKPGATGPGSPSGLRKAKSGMSSGFFGGRRSSFAGGTGMSRRGSMMMRRASKTVQLADLESSLGPDVSPDGRRRSTLNPNDSSVGAAPAKPTSIPLLPPLPEPPKLKEYPMQKTRLISPAVPVLPVLPPHPPGRVAMACFANPQNGKFGYGSNVHRDTVYLAKQYNPIFADQALTEFHFADRTRREALTVLDLTRYVTQLCDRYDYHPGKYLLAARQAEASLTSRERDQRHHRLASVPMLSPTDKPTSSGFDDDGETSGGGGDLVPTQSGALQIAIPITESTEVPGVGDANGLVSPKALRKVPSETRDAAKDGTLSMSNSMSMRRSGTGLRARPQTPLADVAREFAESAWSLIAEKRNFDETITLREFADIVANYETTMTPVFRLHFTWLDKDAPEALAYDGRRRRRVVDAMSPRAGAGAAAGGTQDALSLSTLPAL